MKIGINEALNKAILAQKNGEIKDASEIYVAILKKLPNHPDANHNMGALSATLGNPGEAVRFFQIALKANPNVQQYWLSYITLLIKLNRMNEAQKLYEKAENIGITKDPFAEIKYKLKGHSPNSIRGVEHYPLDGHLTTKQVAKKAGIHRDTLLRWLRVKSVAEPKRDRRGWRIFTISEAEAICCFAQKKTYYHFDGRASQSVKNAE